MNKQDVSAYAVGFLTALFIFITWAVMVWLTNKFPLLIIGWVIALHGLGMFNLRNSRNEREAEEDLYDDLDPAG
jgi:uncharacterized membrane protein YGL010W